MEVHKITTDYASIKKLEDSDLIKKSIKFFFQPNPYFLNLNYYLAFSSN